MPPAVVDQEYWMMYFDGSLKKKGAGARLVFVSPLGVRMRYMVRLHFSHQIMWPNTKHSSTAYASPSSWASDASTFGVTLSWSLTKS